MSLSVVVVGLGQIGMGYDLELDSQRYAMTHARAFARHPSFKLVAGVDENQQKRAKFESSYGCASYSNVQEALKMHSADVIVIALPTQCHFSSLEQILHCASPRVILCEKPLDHDALQAAKMVECCEQRNIMLFVNYTRRANPAVLEVKRRLDSGIISAPVKGRIWYSKGWMHNASHFFNLMEYWLGPAMSSSLLKTMDTDDEELTDVDAYVVHANGDVAYLVAGGTSFGYHEVELMSPTGRLRYGSDSPNILWQSIVEDGRFTGYTMLSPDVEEISTDRDNYQLHVVEQIYVALRGGDTQLCTGRKALSTMTQMWNIFNNRT